MYGFPGVFEALLLISLGIGYFVLYFAKREEKLLQFVGYVAGCLIITLATIYLLGNLYLQAKMGCTKMQYYKGMMQQPMPMHKLPARR
jgi:multisubunit Na+/H+ antiporter MnhB subunit